MSSKAPKTGLAARMRAWMSGRQDPYTAEDIFDALELASGQSKRRVRQAVQDFAARGEVFPDGYSVQQNRRQPLYRYNAAWQRGNRAVMMPKIHKAIYVAGTFSSRDIARLSEADHQWVQEIIRKLRKDGMIARVGRRVPAKGTGVEDLYNIPNRDRYRMEVLR